MHRVQVQWQRENVSWREHTVCLTCTAVEISHLVKNLAVYIFDQSLPLQSHVNIVATVFIPEREFDVS